MPQKMLSHAYWESARKGLIVLSENWTNEREKPPLFLSPPKRPFHSLEAASPLVFARMSGYVHFRNRFLFAVCLADHLREKLIEHGTFVAGPFNNWDPLQDKRKWRLRQSKLEGTPYAVLPLPDDLLQSGNPFTFKFVTGDGHWIDVSRSAPNACTNDEGITNFLFHPKRTGKHMFFFEVPEDFPLTGNEVIVWSDENIEETIHLPPTSSFLEIFSGEELGAIPSDSSTIFRIFAPRAVRVWVEYFSKPSGDNSHKVDLEFTKDGLWEVQIPKNLQGWYYYFGVDGKNRDTTTDFQPKQKILDPYAKAATGRAGPGIILGKEHFPTSNLRNFEAPRWDDLIVCECHIRDVLKKCPLPLTADERRGYRGLAKWIRTGKSYFHELGVNAVELQPIQEFDSQSAEEYHWGYMPVNYFSPESTYSSAPEKASQVEEFRDLVRAFHEEGFTVILDVVYNHIGEPNNLLFIDKYYYFHLDNHHHLENWSGCGNDLRTDAPMVRRLIVDSLFHLVRQYGVDGFRFDLADLVGKETLLEIERTLKNEFPDLILIAEPWSFRGHIADALKDTAFSSWNDGYRDFLKEYVQGNNNRDAAEYFLSGSAGSRTEWPAQTVNFTESHDDYCWLDHITENEDCNGAHPTPSDRRRTHLMAAYLLSSLGIPMIAAGQDGLRTKHGVENTYQRGDLNALDYERRSYYSGTAQYFARWIRLRLSPIGKLFRPGAHFPGYLSTSQVEDSSAIACLYNANHKMGGDHLLFAINPHTEPVFLPLPEGASPIKWVQIADHERVEREGLEGALLPLSKEGVYIPALCCGLWKSR